MAATARAWSDALRYLAARPNRGDSRPSATRRILLLARDCPPSVTGGVYRVSALINALAHAAWATEVIAGPQPPEPDAAGMELARQLPESVRIHRWAPSGWTPSWKFSPFVDGGFGSIGRILDLARRHKLFVDAIIATGPTFAEFVAGAVLAKNFGVPLVLDYRDEWCENRETFIERGPTDRFWERWCLARAQAVVFTTESSRRHYLDAFPFLDPEKMHVVMNGWDELPSGEPPATSQRSSKESDTCQISFFGWLGDRWDLPEFAATLLRALQGAPELVSHCRFRFVGNKSPENLRLLASPALGAVTAAVPQMPFTQARREMRTSAALLLLNNAALDRVLPAKLFEYIAARRPVLLYGLGGEMEGCLRTVPGTRCVARGDAQGLIAALTDIRTGIAEEEISRAPASAVQGFRREVQMKRFLALLDRLSTPATSAGVS